MITRNGGQVSKAFSCLSCRLAAMDSLEEQRDHYRTEWHRYNLKRKVADLPALSFEEFSHRQGVHAAGTATLSSPENSRRTDCPHCE